MSHNLKPGDLALTLVDRFDWPAMTVVELQRFAEKGEILIGDGETIRLKSSGWIVSLPGSPDICRGFKPEHLMPLRGDFAPEQQKSREVVA